VNTVRQASRCIACAQIAAAVLIIPLGTASCDLEPADDARVESVVAGIVAACPVTRADDEAARDDCSEQLGNLEVLREVMAEPFLWGGAAVDGDDSLEGSHTTRFNPFVWRKMYLSVMMFPGSYTLEHVGDRTVVHLPYELRQLDIGSYPYPFWHKKAKWDSYQLSTELLLFFDGGKLVGALRSKQQDPSRPTVERSWDGRFVWTDDDGQPQPHVTLYSYLFSPENPHIAELDAAYRAFESRSRAHNCATCHDPGNSANMNPLELFSFPNQALSARHTLVEQLEDNPMPPAGATAAGIADDVARSELIQLAKDFARVGDLALAYEGEPR
jgi:hypothetical protein